MKTNWTCALICATAACAGVASMAALAAAKVPTKHMPAGLPEYVILKPVSYKNLTIYPVALAGERDQKSLAGRYITLDEGLKTGGVEVREMGGGDDDGTPLQRERPGRGGAVGFGFQAQQLETRQLSQAGPEVNRLALYNRSGKHLMLLAGEMVVGGRQDRIVQKDTLVPPGPKPLPLAVFCVEHGRWEATSTKFSNQIVGGGGGFGGGMADSAVRGVAQNKADQVAVWNEVAGRGQTLGGASSTGTYQKMVASPRAIRDTADYLKAFDGKILREGVVGAVARSPRRFERGKHLMQPLILNDVLPNSSEWSSRLRMSLRNQTNSRVRVVPENPQREGYAQYGGLSMFDWSKNDSTVVLLDGRHPFAMMGRRSEPERVLEERGEIPSRQSDGQLMQRGCASGLGVFSRSHIFHLLATWCSSMHWLLHAPVLGLPTVSSLYAPLCRQQQVQRQRHLRHKVFSDQSLGDEFRDRGPAGHKNSCYVGGLGKVRRATGEGRELGCL